MLNEQQKRALENRRQSGHTPSTANNSGKIGQPSDLGLLQAMRQNPQMATFWVRSKEEALKQKLCMSRGS